MLKSLTASALGAGLAAGFLAAGLQILLLVPLIGEAELYESGTLTHFSVDVVDGHDHVQAADDHNHSSAAETAEPHEHGASEHGDGQEGGMWRPLLTVLSSVATYTGFALLMVAGFALAEGAGLARITARQGMLWGLAGFAATQFLPALGLAPELPGSGAAALEARQLWWLVTAAMTLAGIGVLAAVNSPLRFAGVVLIALPHIFGAPHPEGYAGVTPPELAALFAARVLVVGAVGWLALGWLAGLLWSRETAA